MADATVVESSKLFKEFFIVYPPQYKAKYVCKRLFTPKLNVPRFFSSQILYKNRDKSRGDRLGA